MERGADMKGKFVHPASKEQGDIYNFAVEMRNMLASELMKCDGNTQKELTKLGNALAITMDFIYFFYKENDIKERSDIEKEILELYNMCCSRARKDNWEELIN